MNMSPFIISSINALVIFQRNRVWEFCTPAVSQDYSGTRLLNLHWNSHTHNIPDTVVKSTHAHTPIHTGQKILNFRVENRKYAMCLCTWRYARTTIARDCEKGVLCIRNTFVLSERCGCNISLCDLSSFVRDKCEFSPKCLIGVHMHISFNANAVLSNRFFSWEPLIAKYTFSYNGRTTSPSQSLALTTAFDFELCGCNN